MLRGLVQEHKFLNAGFVFGPFCTVYGFGGLAVVVILQPLGSSPLLVLALSVVIASAIEYVGHWLLDKLFSLSLWDYSGRFCNLHGRICLMNSLAFGVLSLIALYGVQPLLAKMTASLPPQVIYVVALGSAVWFVYDLLGSMFVASRIDHILSEADRYRRTRHGRLHHRMAKRYKQLSHGLK